MFSFDDHEIWDEFEWESHIDEMTRRHEHLRELIETSRDKRPRWLLHLKDYPTKHEAVDAFIEEELLIEESHFPTDDEDEFEDGEETCNDWADEDDDWDLDNDNMFEDSEENNSMHEDADTEDFESLFEDIFEEESSEESLYDYASLENIAIYTDARDFSADLLLFNDSKPRYLNHAGFIRLVSETLFISSKLAAAYSMGFDVEVLGANIAYCKKALYKANNTLELLHMLKGNPLNSKDYNEIHLRLFELRNNIAIHIQDTREFFNSLR